MRLTGPTVGVPTSTMTFDGTQAKYCVAGYAPDRVVTINDAADRLQVTVRTHISGAGCTELPAHAVCGHAVRQSAVATGVGADGNPATSRATVSERAAPATCPPTASPTHHASTAGGRVSLSGAGLVLLVVAGVALLGIAALGTLALRRRRSQ